MTELRNMDSGIAITSFVSLKEKQEVIRTIHKTLDGRQLISRYGFPAVSYELTVYVKDDGRQALLSAEDDLSLLKVTTRDKTYFGRIIKLSDFERISQEYFKSKVTLAKEVDV
ncbi:MAG: hypothetical protein PHY15_00275 [Eubacteriales bacterium]|nr:hypothetical protein [Eubacteriales bacterium]MDD4475544.1 hypothetical protein [Eubacteriales bacterium]